MAMQTDVKSTKPLASTGFFKTQSDADMSFRSRIKGIYASCGTSAGSVVISDGDGGSTLFTMATPTAASTGYVYIILPDQGILAENGLYGTVTNTASVTIFYG
jgi:hypothetical protein